MERREGDAFRFNEPMLESFFPTEEPLIVSLLFLLPGRHAGPDGDVATICAQASMDDPKGSTDLTTRLADSGICLARVIGEHPAILAILWKQFTQAFCP